jgi:hypothetical protein
VPTDVEINDLKNNAFSVWASFNSRPDPVRPAVLTANIAERLPGINHSGRG